MEISSNYSPLVSTNCCSSNKSRYTHEQKQPDKQAQEHTKTSQAAKSSPQTRPVVQLQRQPVYLQPMFDQSLTRQGQQAARTYLDVEFGGETELLNRLDETA